MDVRVWLSICLIFFLMQATASGGGKVLFASAQSIIEVDVDTRNVTVLVGHGGSVVFSLDYDYDNEYVYFPRLGFSDIVRFPYPSQNITLQHVVKTSSVPSGVAVDSANDHVYWVYDNGGHKLSRCKSDGTNVVVLFTTLRNTLMLRLDVANRWMYIGYFPTGITKSKFDLTDISMIANFTSNTQVRSVGMDIDLNEQRMYWMNYDGDIKSVNVDGSDVKTIISTNSASLDYYAFGVMGSYIYYADNNNQLVMRNKSQGSTPTVLYTDSIRVKGIYVFNSTEDRLRHEHQTFSDHISMVLQTDYSSNNRQRLTRRQDKVKLGVYINMYVRKQEHNVTLHYRYSHTVTLEGIKLPTRQIILCRKMNDSQPFRIVDKKTNTQASQGKDTFRSQINRLHLDVEYFT